MRKGRKAFSKMLHHDHAAVGCSYFQSKIRETFRVTEGEKMENGENAANYFEDKQVNLDAGKFHDQEFNHLPPRKIILKSGPIPSRIFFG